MDNPKLRYQQLLSEASFHLLALKLLEYLSRLPKCFSLIGKKRKTWQSTVHYKTILIIELHFLVYSKLNFLENNFIEKKSHREAKNQASMKKNSYACFDILWILRIRIRLQMTYRPKTKKIFLMKLKWKTEKHIHFESCSRVSILIIMWGQHGGASLSEKNTASPIRQLVIDRYTR